MIGPALTQYESSFAETTADDIWRDIEQMSESMPRPAALLSPILVPASPAAPAVATPASLPAAPPRDSENRSTIAPSRTPAATPR
jgi:hypothetical protein